jgi:hypothetical protein
VKNPAYERRNPSLVFSRRASAAGSPTYGPSSRHAQRLARRCPTLRFGLTGCTFQTRLRRWRRKVFGPEAPSGFLLKHTSRRACCERNNEQTERVLQESFVHHRGFLQAKKGQLRALPGLGTKPEILAGAARAG